MVYHKLHKNVEVLAVNRVVRCECFPFCRYGIIWHLNVKIFLLTTSINFDNNTAAFSVLIFNLLYNDNVTHNMIRLRKTKHDIIFQTHQKNIPTANHNISMQIITET